MTIQKVILIADARGRINIKDQDTIRRHCGYINAFRNLQNYEDTELYVIQPSLRLTGGSTEIFDNLVILGMSIKNLLLLRRTIHPGSAEVILIVSGDPWESYFFSQFLKLLLRNSRIPIQVQIHAELSLAWAKLSFKNRIRRMVAFATIKKVSGIRAVSEEQRRYIIEKCALQPSQIVAIPVRLNVTKPNLRGGIETRPFSIGLVGRLHAERNIEKFVEIAKYFLKQFPNLRIVIVGSAARSRKYEKMLLGISPTQVDFLGKMDSDKMGSAWSRIGVLVSTAESESYGRSIREALTYDIPVLAFSSMGSRDLERECPESVRIFTDEQSNSEIFTMFENLLSSRVPSCFALDQQERDSRINHDIAFSWKETSERKAIG